MSTRLLGSPQATVSEPSVFCRPAKVVGEPQQGDTFSLQFQKVNLSQIKAALEKTLPPLLPESSMYLQNLMEYLHPRPVSGTWPIALMKFLLADNSVQKYLNEHGLKPYGNLYKGLHTILPEYLQRQIGNQKETLSKELFADIIQKTREFAASEGKSEVTPVQLWYWLMKADPSETMTPLLKGAGFNDQMITRLRELPPPQDARKATETSTERPTKQEILALEKAMQTVRSKVLGQDEGLESLIRGIETAKLGYRYKDNNPNKPHTCSILLGPSGVGKTYSAEVLAAALGRPLVYIRLSEYIDEQSVSKVGGAAPGYIGYGDGGSIADKVIKANQESEKNGTPPPIVVFDEMEKANPVIFDSILQVLDKGELENGSGQKAKFKGVDIIMTSNIGQDEIKEAREKGIKDDALRETLINEMKKTFRLEFIGRLTNIIIYKDLSKSDGRKILNKSLSEFTEFTRKVDGIDLKIEPLLREHILDKGFSSEFGVRHLNNVITEILGAPLTDERKKLIKNDALAPFGIASGQMIASLENDQVKLEYTPIGGPENQPQKP